MAYRVSVNAFARRIAKMGPELEAATIKGLQSAALRLESIIPEAIADTKPFVPSDTGQLHRSHYHEFTARGALVGVDAPHAPFMEYGTRPHRPPFQPLADWAYRKGIVDVQVSDADLQEYWGRLSLGDDAPEVSGDDLVLREATDEAIAIVLAIVGKIQREGIEPRRFMKRSIIRFSRRKILQQEVMSELDEIGFGEIARKTLGDMSKRAATSARARKQR